ncbi:hypothetical protein [Mycobacteroides salmoniphilum]|nr:hypothetical protein [Mycobacteroides salmoniphilum]TDZ97842.1 hypothetical protein CCUG62472_00871 [Mycobacteroides salmoniphilum]
MDSGTIVGEVCHIRAQSANGPRYEESQSDEERHGFDNLVLMCGVHHKFIDAKENLATYTVEALVEIKHSHENEARASGQEPDAPPNVIAALMLTATVYESGSVHMDFSNAVFKVGGEGGSLAGGGGAGGVLTIVGIASLPPSVAEKVDIELKGGNGQWPGSGGGGGGLLVFEGRAVTESDIANGLQVPLFFPAESARVADSLLNVLGAGWEYFWVNEFPWSGNFALAYMVDFGSVQPNTLLGVEFSLLEPSGKEVPLGAVDVAAPEPKGQLNRSCQVATVPVQIDSAGLYELTVGSGSFCFARYSVEIRLKNTGT